MKKALTQTIPHIWHFADGKKVFGVPADLTGEVSGLYGDVTGMRGDVSGLRGDVSGLWGNVSGLRGDVTGLRGNVDACEITDEERSAGVDVQDLMA